MRCLVLFPTGLLWCLYSLPLFAQRPSMPRNAQEEVARALRLHRDTLARIKSIYIKIETWEEPLAQEVAKKPRKIGITEAWRAEIRERCFKRIFEIIGPEGVEKIPEGLLRDRSLDDKEVRDLNGWDPETVPAAPLGLDHLCKVEGFIWKRGPEATPPFVWNTLLFEVQMGVSLAQAAAVSELDLLPPESPGTVLLTIKTSKNPLLADMRIELDSDHGHLIRKIVRKPKIIWEVKEFSRLAEGIWVPRRMTTSLRGVPATRFEVVECQVNTPIPDAKLQVRFPEGARVWEQDKGLKGLFHIWGKGRPEKTFTNDKDLLDYLVKNRGM